ncbi:hypothetical protein BDA99DRAFT_496687 [Phascolomyces articulosus]|uniref:PH domain-containing protein n=1 Tax=Phascolomyces articulosus TaxID=60185 RepID=A0AAD5KNF5_9FUNG|nr:hypothetical protein BDA99DRAFT_496687 [Phascolomyces articulosus]
MKSKKSKSSTSNKSDEHRTSALSFFKNRLFSSNESSNTNNNTESSPSTTTTHTSSSSRFILHRSPISIDIPKSAAMTASTDWSGTTTHADRPMSKSFEDPMYLEVSHSTSSSSTSSNATSTVAATATAARKTPRPVSMMGLRRITTGGSSSGSHSTTTTDHNTGAVVNKRRRPPDEDPHRSSFIIIKEGFLYKKADFRAFHKPHNHRGWKLYRIVLRGHKLYLYKLSSESPLRSLVPSPKHHRQLQTSLFLQQQLQQQQQQQKEESIVIHNPADLFHDEKLRDGYIYGAKFKDHQQQQQRYVALLIFTNEIVIGTCMMGIQHQQQQQPLKWKEIDRIPLDKLQVEKRGNELVLMIDQQPKKEERIYISLSTEVQSAWMNAFESQAGLPRIKISKEDEEEHMSQDENSKHSLHVTKDTDGRRIVLGGTVEALIHELLTSEVLDQEYMNAFLLTFPMYTSSTTINTILNTYISNTPQQVADRILDIFQFYATQFMQDVVGDVANGIISILERLESIESVDKTVREKSTKVKELVLATVKHNGDEAGGGNGNNGNHVISNALAPPTDTSNISSSSSTSTAASEEGGKRKKMDRLTVEDIPRFNKQRFTPFSSSTTTPRQQQLQRPISVNLSNMLITGLTPGLFLTIDPDSFAEQVYWFHRSQQCQHESTLINPLTYVPRPQTSPQVVNSLVFTTASPHFLTKLIRNHILIDSQQGGSGDMEMENLKLNRSMLLEHWIRVGIALTQLGDMTGWCAVAVAICSLGVIRLKESWKSVDRSLVVTVTQQWVGLLADYGLFAQDMWMEGWEKTVAVDTFARIMNPQHRSFTEQGQQQHPGLPFFGTLRQAVDRLRKHLKDEYNGEKGVVNFSKYWGIYHAVRQGLDTWTIMNKNTMRQIQEEQEGQVPSFKVVGPLQAFFEHSVTDFISVPHDFKYLQECSLACEPRIFGQSYDRHRKFDSLHHGTDVAPPSSATLTFPEVLEGYTLFQHHLDHHATSPQRSSLNLRKKKSTQSMKSEDMPHTPLSATSAPLSHHPQQPHSNRPPPPDHARSSPRVTRRKMFRRRTYSFPPGGAGVSSSSSSSAIGSMGGADTETIHSLTSVSSSGGGGNSSNKKSEEYSDSYLESHHSRTWLGSLISHRHGSYSAKAILDAVQQQRRDMKGGPNGGASFPHDWILLVENGNLVLKASTLVQADDSVTRKPLKKSTSSGFLVLADKGSSGIRSRSSTTISMTAAAPTANEAIQKKEEEGEKVPFGSSDNINKEGDKNNSDSSTPIFVNVKAGRLERLVEVLVGGVSRYNKEMREQWHLSNQLMDQEFNAQQHHLALDEEEYVNAFFVTYRSFCSVVELLELLREIFTGAIAAGQLIKQQKTNVLESVFQTATAVKTKEDENSATSTVVKMKAEDFDWRVVVSIQLRVVNLMLHWMEEHFYDFVDEIEILNHIGRFLQQAQDALEAWRTVMQQSTITTDQQASLAAARHIDRQLEELRKQFIHKILSPSYDLKAIDYDTGCSRKVDELYKQLTSGTQGFRTAIKQGTRKSMAFSLSTQPTEEEKKSIPHSKMQTQQQQHGLVDQKPASLLLKQADQCVRQLFASVTLQDWIQTFDVFEAQSSDLYAWLPSHKASQTPSMSMTLSPVRDAPSAQPTDYHISQDDVMISDVFTAIEGARRSIVSPSAFSADDLLLAFPSSIQYLYCMHFIIRSWVIHEITSRHIDFQTRVHRIDKFLQMVVLSKSATEQMLLFPELKDVEDRPRRVPGFVEYAIASALISPEVRLFSKAWIHVSHRYGSQQHSNQQQQHQPETLECLLSHVQRSIHNNNNKADTMVLVPSVGWVFDRMLELCAAVPDTYNHKEHMINFDKRRYVFHFLQLVMNAQMDLEEQQQQQQDIDEEYLSFIICPDRTKSTWKEFKDYATKENKKEGGIPGTTGSGNSSGGSSLSSTIRGTSNKGHHGVFGKLVVEQQEKLKRDIKERDRIDKEWRDLQHKLQKRQNEQARYLEKQERKGHHQQPPLPIFNSLFRGLRPTSLSNHSSSTSTTGSLSPISPTTTTTTSDPSFSVHFYQTAKASTVINLIHATTSVASAYTKRDHVFRIVTEEGGQYLFQASHWEEMHDWIQHINNAAREGAVKRRSVLASDEQEKRSSRFNEEDPLLLMNKSSGTSDAAHTTSTMNTRKSVYGVDLVHLMEDGSVPLLVEKCIAEIEKRGLEEVGIYRTAGTGSVVEQLKEAFNSDMKKVNLGDPQWADINVVADAFKQFLRNIPSSLMTHIYYDQFILAAASEDHDQRVYLIKQVIQKLPDPNYTLLKRLIEHFVIVTDFEATNHMYATNLAIVFGPTLLQPAPGPASFATTMSNLGHHQTIVKYLILHFHYFFDIEEQEEESVTTDDVVVVEE